VYFEYICWKIAGRLLDRVNTPLLCLDLITTCELCVKTGYFNSQTLLALTYTGQDL